ncbi:MAG TPA: hypothetical protein VG324_11000 [Blastocatellia bacterium]|nr:hypothetical protein [Blastocatellia bacterium]
MSNRSTITLGARVLVLSLIFNAFGIFSAGSTLAAKNRGVETQTAGAQDGNSQLNGQLIANGPVTVNGNKAITGTTVFNGSNIIVDCAKGNSAVVNLGKLGRIELVAGTKMTLRFSEGLISGDLQDGKAVISTPQDVRVEVKTPDGVVTSNCVQVQQTSCVTPVAVQGFVQCVPVVAARPIPVPHGVGTWGLVGGLLAGAGVTGAALAGATIGDNGSPSVPTVTPTLP